jgi:intracellular sulfur oxidation DsrE/DsrF family protein
VGARVPLARLTALLLVLFLGLLGPRPGSAGGVIESEGLLVVRVAAPFDEPRKHGIVYHLTFGARGNTIRGLKITLADLPEGTRELPQGGVVRVMELQEQGYAYVRP